MWNLARIHVHRMEDMVTLDIQLHDQKLNNLFSTDMCIKGQAKKNL